MKTLNYKDSKSNRVLDAIYVVCFMSWSKHLWFKALGYKIETNRANDD